MTVCLGQREGRGARRRQEIGGAGDLANDCHSRRRSSGRATWRKRLWGARHTRRYMRRRLRPLHHIYSLIKLLHPPR